jgi:hypothetical protein
MKAKADEFKRELLKEFPDISYQEDLADPKRADGVSWVTVLGLIPGVEVECGPRGFGVHVHFPNDPNDVGFTGPDAIFSTTHLALIFIKAIWGRLQYPADSGDKWVLARAVDQVWAQHYGKYSVHLKSTWNIVLRYPLVDIIEEGNDASEVERSRLVSIQNDLLTIEMVMSS